MYTYHGQMIAGAVDLVPDLAALDAVERLLWNDEGIDAPARAAAPALAAPSIVGVVSDGVGMPLAPCVAHVRRCQHAAVRIALCLRVPSRLVPLFRGAGQVAVVPDDVEIAAPNHVLVLGLEGEQVLFERVVPAILVRQCLEPVAGVDRIRPDQHGVREFDGQHACLGAGVVKAGQAVVDVHGLALREDSDARVPLFLANAPVSVLVHSIQAGVRRHLVHLGLGQHDHVRVFRVQVPHEPLVVGALERRNVPDRDARASWRTRVDR